MNVTNAIGSIPILQASNGNSMVSLVELGILKKCTAGKHLFFDRDDVDNIYFLVDGKASLYKISLRQEKKVVFICGPGSLLNEEIFDGKPTSVNCELLSDAYVLSFDRQKFLNVCRQDFGLTIAVINAMTQKIRRFYRQMKNTVNSVYGDKRIAAKLWKLSRDYGTPCENGVKIDLSLTITYLAELLGSKRETVSRRLKVFTDRGLLKIDKSSFIIPDRDLLRKYFYEP